MNFTIVIPLPDVGWREDVFELIASDMSIAICNVGSITGVAVGWKFCCLVGVDEGVPNTIDLGIA